MPTSAASSPRPFWDCAGPEGHFWGDWTTEPRILMYVDPIYILARYCLICQARQEFDETPAGDPK